VAGTQSGVGKTTITLSIMASLKRQGIKVAPFKVGPDFIDPGHHYHLTNIISRNLDGWMLSKNDNLKTFNKNISGMDIAVVEGVMGLFDGYDGRTEAGSTAQMAKWLDLPILLVVDARSMARSAAALLQGFENFDPRLRFCGVIFNKVGSPTHLAYLKEAMDGNVKMPCLGGIMRTFDIIIPERHLGLLTADDYSLSANKMNQMADIVDQQLDMENFLARLTEYSPNELPKESEKPSPKVSIKISPKKSIDDQHQSNYKECQKKVRIGIAKDKAFCFYYAQNLEMLALEGAELIFFSPIQDEKLPNALAGIYFGGGYPELHAKKISENQLLLGQISQVSRQGMPIYAECGGFMYLCKELIDKKEHCYQMAGCFPFTAKMQNKLKALGYREITFSTNLFLGNKGTTVRGHEFHYSAIQPIDDGANVHILSTNDRVETCYTVKDRGGQAKQLEGYRINQTVGSYAHLHFGSCPELAKNFVNACLMYQQERKIKCNQTKLKP
jgi:cobyrinic acid a,c-diamide synthase